MSVAVAGPEAARAGSSVARAPRSAAEAGTTTLPAFFHDAAASGVPLRRFLLTDPLRAVRALVATGRLPVLRMTLPDTVGGRAIAREVRSHPVIRGLFRGTTSLLSLPAEASRYATGPRRATLRRKVRAAERQGVVVRLVPEAERAALLVAAKHHEQHGAPPEYRIAEPANDDLPDFDLWLAAYDADGAPLALTVIPIAGPWAVLRYFRTLSGGRTASDARYLLHAALVEELRQRGVRHLVDGVPPWWLPSGLQHFQRMLGFRLVRLRVGAPRRSPTRGRAAALSASG